MQKEGWFPFRMLNHTFCISHTSEALTQLPPITVMPISFIYNAKTTPMLFSDPFWVLPDLQCTHQGCLAHGWAPGLAEDSRGSAGTVPHARTLLAGHLQAYPYIHPPDDLTQVWRCLVASTFPIGKENCGVVSNTQHEVHSLLKLLSTLREALSRKQYSKNNP